MTRGFDFSFEYEWQGEEEETVVLAVEATMSESRPASYGDLGDPGWPAEGGEIEYTSIKDPYGEEWDVDEPTLVSRWHPDPERRGRALPGMGQGWREWVTVPLHEAMDDAATDAAADHAY